jgi:hypothetical protein
MLSGAPFPEKSQVREPIINVLFYFKKVPSVERLKERLTGSAVALAAERIDMIYN